MAILYIIGFGKMSTIEISMSSKRNVVTVLHKMRSKIKNVKQKRIRNRFFLEIGVFQIFVLLLKINTYSVKITVVTLPADIQPHQ